MVKTQTPLNCMNHPPKKFNHVPHQEQLEGKSHVSFVLNVDKLVVPKPQYFTITCAETFCHK